jgi:hypothetical protein
VIEAAMARMRKPKALTLSTVSSHSLAEALDWLLGAWRRFRDSKEYRRRVRAALVVIEVTWNAVEGWHPHLHGVIDCLYWQQSGMAKLWVRATGGVANPAAQWIKKVNTRKGLACYLSGYLSKGVLGAVDTLPVERLAELIEATWGLRMVRTYGACYGVGKDIVHRDGMVKCEECGAPTTRLHGGIDETLALAELYARERKERERGPPDG